jgi:predicted GIY-YIG superfamily endonuclease
MGSPLSPLVCDIFMEDLEERAIESAAVKPLLYKRYVDDTFVIWPESMQPVEHFLDHLNNQSSSIKFTMEKEQDEKIPFLDVLVYKNNNKLSTAVYRKKTDSGRYLNYNSNHPPAVKRGIANTLITRAETHCKETTTKNEEIKHIKNVLRNNDYPEYIVPDLQRKRNNNTDKQQEKPITTMTIPYVTGLSEKIQKIGTKMLIRTTFSSSNTIKKQLCNVKPKNTQKCKECIYSIPCECGLVYIGQTARPYDVRISEHQKCVTDKLTHKSKLAEHSRDNKHKIIWDDVKVVGTEKNTKKREIAEAAIMISIGEVISQPSHNIGKQWYSILKGNNKESGGSIIHTRPDKPSLVGTSSDAATYLSAPFPSTSLHGNGDSQERRVRRTPLPHPRYNLRSKSQPT